MRGFALTGIVALALAGCAKPITGEECTAVLDRYVAQKLHMDPTLLGRPDRERHEIVAAGVRDNHERTTYRLRHGECMRTLSRRQFTCAMNAINPDVWEACMD